jgi:hypothetical protein
LGKIGGDFQNEFFVLAIKLQSFDKSLHYAGNRIAMVLNVTLCTGETAARIVETELAHIDERVETQLLRGNVLRGIKTEAWTTPLLRAARRVGAAPTAKKLTSRSGLIPLLEQETHHGILLRSPWW